MTLTLTRLEPDVAIGFLGTFTSADDLAAYFLDEEIIGTLGDGGTCPIARWLLAVTSWEFWDVHGNCILGADPVTGNLATWDTPEGAAEFIDRFDCGAFPQLVDLVDFTPPKGFLAKLHALA